MERTTGNDNLTPRAEQPAEGERTHNLARDSARSGLLVLVGNVIEAGSTVGTMIILARLLDIADFGLFAMASVVATFLLQLNTMGIWAAIVQRPTLSDAVCQRVFRMSVKLNVAVVVVLAALGPVMAWFFGEPMVMPLVWALALGVFIDGIASVPDGLVRRQMRYGIISVIDLTAAVVSAGVALVVGWWGGGAWALVSMQLGPLVISGGGRCLVCGWRPRWNASATDGRAAGDDADTGAVMRYGFNFTAAKLVRFLGRNADQIIIGRLAGAGPLGLYSAAYRWAVFPVKQVHTPMLSVCVSSFSRLQDDPERLRGYVRRAFTLLYSIILPTLALLFVEAEPVIRLLLGEKWLAATPIFRWLLVGMVAETPLLLNKYIYYSDGRTGKQAKWTAVEAAVMALGAAGGAWIGTRMGTPALGVAAGHTISCWLLILPSARNCAAGALVAVADLVKPMVRPGVAAVAAGVVVAALHDVLPPLYFVTELGIASAAFAVAYAVGWVLLPGGRHEAAGVWRTTFRSVRAKR